MLKIAFQGVRGAYSEVAVNKLLNEEKADVIPMHSFEDVFKGIENGDVDRGVIPIENSLTGSIHKNYDLLLQHNLWIIGEVKVRIMHNLIVNQEVEFKDIKRIYSHPQGLSQCEKYLRQFPHIEMISAYDTAGSAKMIKEKGMMDAAAIASKQAAFFYEMVVLEEGIEDDAENYTRFFLLSNKEDVNEEANKTSIAYAADNIPGALFKSLSVFALRDINLLKIESRPVHGKPWEYFFYIDFEENINNDRGINAINHLKEIATYFKVLGCYPKG